MGSIQGRKSKPKRWWTEDELDIVWRLFERGWSDYRIAKILGRPRASVALLLKRGRPGIGAKPFPNPFEPMTHAGAWVLGLWITDGNIEHTLGRATLGQTDKELLENVANIIAPGEWRKHCIIIEEPRPGQHSMYRLRVNSVRFVRFLLHWGVVPRKSMIVRWPEHLPSEFVSSFLRGCWDGDGTITAQKDAYSIGLHTGLVSASVPFLQRVVEAIEANIGYRPPIYHSSGRTYQVMLRNGPAIAFLDWIYSTSTETTRLARKYERYLELRRVAVWGKWVPPALQPTLWEAA